MIGEKANRWKLQDAKFDCKKKWIDSELKRPGIYAIVNRRNGKCYIGQSVNLFLRRASHFRALQKGTHGNAHLQYAYNYYGSTWFEFVVIELCDDLDLNEREQHWINCTADAYNIVLDVTNPASRRTREDTTMYRKDGESFERPAWHTWVYGGAKNPLLSVHSGGANDRR